MMIIWGKDHTTRKDAQVAEDTFKEIELEDMENQRQNLEENLNSVDGEESNEVKMKNIHISHQPLESEEEKRWL